MSNKDPAAIAPSGISPLSEVRYSLKQLLREVEYERQHSALGMELVDQAEIGAIFKTRRRKPAKAKKD
jgi:hypothetical protein